MSDTFNNYKDLEEHVKHIEEKCMSKFIVHSVDADFYDKAWQPSLHQKIYWCWSAGKGSSTPTIEFTGVPFIFVGTKKMGCHRGRDLNLKKKLRYAAAKASKTLQDRAFRRSLRKDTKKIGCPAVINITRIARFPEFKMAENRERARKAAAKRLRQALERDPVVWDNMYLMTTPSVTAHAGHTVGAEVMDVEYFKRVAPSPWRRSRKTALRKKCVNLTKLIMDNVYLIDKQKSLERLSEKLSALLEDIRPMVPNEAGMPLNAENKKSNCSKPPLTQPCDTPDGKFRSRVGVHAEIEVNI